MDAAELREVSASIDDIVHDLGMEPEPPSPRSLAARRRSGSRKPLRRSMVLTVTDGILAVEEGSAQRSFGGLRRRSPRAIAVGGEVVKHVPIRDLERDDVREALNRLDRKLTFGFPEAGGETSEMLRRFDGEKLVPVKAPRQAPGRVLLLIHGTFSSSANVIENLQKTEPGRAFLADATRHYEQLLVFDHPTLSVSPFLNAQRLALLFGDSRADVDVVAHSRGGLVARWWLDSLFRGRGSARAVLVGSPLAGTALAAPPNLRATLSLMANVGRALGAGAAGIPFFAALTGLFEVFSSITRLAAKTPVVDAAIALVPGLRSMSRVGNNRELLGMQAARIDPERYWAVQSNFEPSDEGWRFWRYFRDLPNRARDLAMDAVFDGPNDLVVDTVSMAELRDGLRLPAERIHDFGPHPKVHHTNYFEFPETLAHIRGAFGI